MKKLILLGMLILAIVACQEKASQVKEVTAEPADLTGSIRIAGAYAAYPLLEIFVEAFKNLNPGVTIELQGNGTGKGLEETIAHKADLAMVSRELTPEEEGMGFWRVAIAKDAVVPIYNRENPYDASIVKTGLLHGEMQTLFTSVEKASWGELVGSGTGEPSHVYVRSDGSGASTVFAKFLFVGDSDLVGSGVEGDVNMVESILQDPLGIGYCNMIYIWDKQSWTLLPGIGIVPIDLNNNGKIDYKETMPDSLDAVKRFIQLGKYPSSLCRHLYLVAIDKPSDPVTIAFIKYILTDGQALIESSGFCKVPGYVIECQLKRLGNE